MTPEELEVLIDQIEAEGYIVLGPSRSKMCPQCEKDWDKQWRKYEESLHHRYCPFNYGKACDCEVTDAK